MKRISIVTPSYNQGAYIEDTIRSIWSQEGNFELEHIVADGGSTDNTTKILEKYERLYKNNKYPIKCKKLIFRWWSKKDKGQTDAINHGFNVATGQIVNWINSDDILCSKKSLAIILTAFKQSNADIVCADGKIVDEKARVIGKFALLANIHDNEEFQKKLPLILKGDFISQQSLFFKKGLLKTCPLDINLNYCMDWDLYIKFFQHGFKFYFIKNDIGAIREQPQAKTVIMPPGVYKERLDIYRKNKVWAAGRLHSFIKTKLARLPVLYSLFDYITVFTRFVLPFYRNRQIN